MGGVPCRCGSLVFAEYMLMRVGVRWSCCSQQPPALDMGFFGAQCGVCQGCLVSDGLRCGCARLAA